MVDDNKELLNSWKMTFKQNSNGCCIYESVENPLEAVEKAKEKKYDIIMIDMSMSINNERKSLTRIIKENQKTAIIIGTSAEPKELFSEEDLRDCNEFLEKGHISYKEHIEPILKKYQIITENEEKIQH